MGDPLHDSAGAKLVPGDGLIVAVGAPYRRFVADAVVASRYRALNPEEIARLPSGFQLDHGVSLDRVRVWRTRPWIDEVWPATGASRTDPTAQFRQGIRSISSPDAALIVAAGTEQSLGGPRKSRLSERQPVASTPAEQTTATVPVVPSPAAASAMPSSVHRSDSAVQRAAEATILAAVSDELGVTLAPRSFVLPNGSRVEVDGADPDVSVLVEVFARQGALKGGQQKKVCQDALKLITLQRTHPNARLVVAFADEQAAAYASRGTWVAEALAAWRVDVLIADIDHDLRAQIREAQVRQLMLNADDPDS